MKLPVAERIRLVEAIGDSIAAAPEAAALTDAQMRELDRRLDAFHRDPRQTKSRGIPSRRYWNLREGGLREGKRVTR